MHNVVKNSPNLSKFSIKKPKFGQNSSNLVKNSPNLSLFSQQTKKPKLAKSAKIDPNVVKKNFLNVQFDLSSQKESC